VRYFGLIVRNALLTYATVHGWASTLASASKKTSVDREGLPQAPCFLFGIVEMKLEIPLEFGLRAFFALFQNLSPPSNLDGLALKMKC
jgi:hypothetical protein